MRKASGVLMSSAAALGLLALMPARAAAPVTIEKSLLGVRILQTYKDVLARFGQPRLIVHFGETVLFEPALDPNGNDLGGIRSISYSGGSGGSGGGGGLAGKGGPMSGGMAPSGPGGPMTGGPMMGGKGGDTGAPAMPGGGGGAAGGGAGDSDTTFGAAGGYAFLYHNSRSQLAFMFMFNVDGRVLAVMERGRDGGASTQRGVQLGTSIMDLYERYGWPDTIEEKGSGFILDYSSKYHAKFAIIKDKVVGIGVVLEESTKLPFFPDDNNGGGGGSGAPGGGGSKGGGGGSGGGPGNGARAAQA